MTVYAEIEPEKSHHRPIPNGVKVVLMKKQANNVWPRLIPASIKLSWLTRDFDNIVQDVDSDSEEVVPIVDPSKSTTNCQYDNDTQV